jgi:hypothetical protein
MAVRSAPSRSRFCAVVITCAVVFAPSNLALSILAVLIEFGLRPVLVAHAQQVQVLPSQQKPSVKNLPRDQPAPSQSETIPTLPQQPMTPGGPGSNMREIPLPEIFRGCWSGEVAAVDSMTPLSPDATHVRWLTKLYKLCYKQISASDRWHLTFAETSVAQRSIVSDQRQSVSVKSVAGGDRAELTAYLHFRAPQLNLFDLPSGVVNTLDELTQLHCTVTPDDDAMDVRAQVFVENNGESWVQMTWHTRLLRTD